MSEDQDKNLNPDEANDPVDPNDSNNAPGSDDPSDSGEPDGSVESAGGDESIPDEAQQTIIGKANPEDMSPEEAEAAMLAMMEGEEVGDSDSSFDDKLASLPEADKISPDSIDYGEQVAHPAAFQQLSAETSKEDSRPIDLLMDVSLPIAIELGSTSMSISDILALGPGSVVELNKLAGEPVEVKVNHKTVALGEVVVVDENFGVRVTQLMSAEDRIKTLQE